MPEDWWLLIGPWVPLVVERRIRRDLNPHPGTPYRRMTWTDEEYAEYLRGWNEGMCGGQGWLT